MIVVTTSILALPLIVLLWVLEGYVLLVCVRLVFARLTNLSWAARICDRLKPFTDPLPEAVRRLLSRRFRRPVASWLPWLVAIGGALLMEQLVVLAVVKAF